MRMLIVLGVMLSLIFLTACDSMTVTGGATESELCRQWGYSLPTRSRQDTAQTTEEIQVAYATFSIACSEWEHLIPGESQ